MPLVVPVFDGASGGDDDTNDTAIDSYLNLCDHKDYFEVSLDESLRTMLESPQPIFVGQHLETAEAVKGLTRTFAMTGGAGEKYNNPWIVMFGYSSPKLVADIHASFANVWHVYTKEDVGRVMKELHERRPFNVDDQYQDPSQTWRLRCEYEEEKVHAVEATVQRLRDEARKLREELQKQAILTESLVKQLERAVMEKNNEMRAFDRNMDELMRLRHQTRSLEPKRPRLDEVMVDERSKALRVAIATNGGSCVVCSSEFQVDGRPLDVIVPCGHCYHSECLQQWFTTREESKIHSVNTKPKTCPTCRGEAAETMVLSV